MSAHVPGRISDGNAKCGPESVALDTFGAVRALDPRHQEATRVRANLILANSSRTRPWITSRIFRTFGTDGFFIQ
jgi:hypothetical protein